MAADGSLRMIFLGGVGEIGRNMSLLECGDDILVIDAGLGFPEDDMLGIDIVIPDHTYLVENKHRIRGLVLTHGHEDHVGGFPFFSQAMGSLPPVYATPLTCGLIDAKLREWDDLEEPDFHEVAPGDVIELGCFKVEFIHVNHSIPGACGLGIETPVGNVVHTGDFKIDHTPVDGAAIDAARFTDYGNRGVLLLIADATNAEKPGYVLSERTVGEKFHDIFLEAPGRVIIATFASNIHRIQQVFDVSAQHGRRVCVDGRSMLRNIEVATRLGYLKIAPGTQIEMGDLDDYDPRGTTILTTGSQGEPMSALVRMATGEHRRLKTQKQDTVILSANPIPGNETLIWRTVNNLCRQGAQVIYSRIDDVHVSGHANQEELKLMLSMTRPEYVVPFHGEPRHQRQFSRLAGSMGIEADRVLNVNPYEVLTVGPDGASIDERVPGEPVLVDGTGIGDVGAAVLRERRILSAEGVVFVTAVIDDGTGEILDGPVIESRGFVYVGSSGALLDEAADLATAAIEEAEPNEELEEVEARVRRVLQRAFKGRTGRRPMVIPVIFTVGGEPQTDEPDDPAAEGEDEPDE